MPNSHDIEYRECPFPLETDTHLNRPELPIVLVGPNRRPMVFLGIISFVPSFPACNYHPVQPGDYVVATTKIDGYDSHGLRFCNPRRVQAKLRRES